MSNRTENAMPSAGCNRVAELLPWLVNGSLDEVDAAALKRHVRECDDCRTALERTREAWDLAQGHLPVQALLDYAFEDEPLSSERRHAIESHLEVCPDCCAELELVRSDPSLADSASSDSVSSDSVSSDSVSSDSVSSDSVSTNIVSTNTVAPVEPQLAGPPAAISVRIVQEPGARWPWPPAWPPSSAAVAGPGPGGT